MPGNPPFQAPEGQKSALLEAKELSWGPKGKPDLLSNVSFRAEPGRVLGIVGSNGAGKSTLLRLLYRFHQPRTGQVLINDQDIWGMSPRSAAQKIAAVLQEQPTDFALTVWEIVALGRTPHRRGFAQAGSEDKAIIENALATLNLQDFAKRSFGTLSGGERQRVMVARALAQEPHILILDEPTNHLDIRHQLEVLSLLRRLNMTIITSLHDLNLVGEHTDDVLVLANGQCLAFGPSDQVLTEPLVDQAFGITSRIQRLMPSDQRHFTFHLAR
ncbi:iron ABC transporter ATP-binding protein [Kiloniella litopenaei]|uniref:Iron ABC transporter ATP-binding protein n=1 Tax=Kiloniella litopenaei TaxID=1549748 RepID=A0A0M2RAB0_9PROT|nr:ABC transporter ATP-binding protein [Kiloniella litopenaei]KKJ78757.1 iron ABC transporter ATP-binding protein [Kiloniella litopenaei]